MPWIAVLCSLISSSRSLHPLWLSEGLLSPRHSRSSRLFSLAVAQAQPSYEARTCGAVGCGSMDPGRGGSNVQTTSPWRVESLPSEVTWLQR